MIVDNRFVAGHNWPIIRTDQAGNMYQRRRLRSGAEYDVLKNFPSPASVADALREAGGESVTVHELEFYWYAIYRVFCTGQGGGGGRETHLLPRET